MLAFLLVFTVSWMVCMLLLRFLGRGYSAPAPSTRTYSRAPSARLVHVEQWSKGRDGVYRPSKRPTAVVRLVQ